MAEVEDGTALATEEDAAASAEAGAAEDEAAPTPWRRPKTAAGAPSQEDAAATPEAGATEDEAGTDTMAEAEDGTAPATAGGCSGFG